MQDVAIDDTRFAVFVGHEPIADDEGLYDFYARGGAQAVEHQGGADGFRSKLEANLERVTAVPIGQYDGYFRQDDEVRPGLRPYIVMWTIGNDYWVLYAGVAQASTAVAEARSMVCD